MYVNLFSEERKKIVNWISEMGFFCFMQLPINLLIIWGPHTIRNMDKIRLFKTNTEII